ncbi:MAG: hypothetical protein A3H27_01215 [Acidobacteria bacterium RIFCSPLOWO2_02_FULL_59_13]|nr:MAG: hypothetical protein A3H27_01215 [Acidobacteria bacterium RIFCSPLOWO2_02_FULL_59_13]OFW43255.1 MAG: hypothetical protein A3J28_15140 [Acidobacteria bacterium RIFCSPLOWO2_12_FULL_60_22]
MDTACYGSKLASSREFLEASYYSWRAKFGGMSMPDAKRLKQMETEDARMKKLLSETLLEAEVSLYFLRCHTRPASHHGVRSVLWTKQQMGDA